VRFRRAFTALAAGALGMGIAVAGASPAQAHEWSVPHGADFAKVGPGHTRIMWCDRESDNNPVRAWYFTNTWHITDWAGFPTCGDKMTDHPIIAFCIEEHLQGRVCDYA
jgi:hypothetical protein